MYTPAVFKNNDPAQVSALVGSNPLGILVVNTESDFEVNHIPFVLDLEADKPVRLRAHIPKANPLNTLLTNNTASGVAKCVVIFNGPDGYISPSWYATKKEHGKVVPTWNYSVVHIHGNLTLRTETPWLLQQLTDLTNQNEQGKADAWSVSDAPEAYTEKLMASLVGLEISIDRFTGKTKASQNQPAKNKETILQALQVTEPDSNFHLMVKSALES